MKLILYTTLLIIVLLIIKNCEEPFISRVIESKKVKYLTEYKMGVDYYNSEAGKISNFLSNALKFKAIGANPKQIVENVSSGKFHMGIIKENLLQDAFFGKGVFEKKHINLRAVSRMYPVSIFFISKIKSDNQIKGINDIIKIKNIKNLRIGIYSPKYKFSKKIKSDEKDPSILLYYKLFSGIGLEMGAGIKQYTLEVFNKRDKLLDALDNQEIDFCGVNDVFSDSDILNKWSKKEDASNFYIFGLDDLSDYKIKFMFPRMKISNLDLTFKPYDKNKEPNINKELLNVEIVTDLMEYLFTPDNFYWNSDNWINIRGRDKMFNEQKSQWTKIKDDQKKRNTILLKNQLTIEKTNILNNINISTKFINIYKSEYYVSEVKVLEDRKKLLLKSTVNTTLKQNNLSKKIKDIKKKIGVLDKKLAINKTNKINFAKLDPSAINSITDLKKHIQTIIIERNKLLNEKQEIKYNLIPLNFNTLSSNQNFPYWNPFIINELRDLNAKTFRNFIVKYETHIESEINKLKLQKKTTQTEKKIVFLNNKKGYFSKYKINQKDKAKGGARGYIDVTTNKNPMSKRGISPVTFKTIQEYYVLFSEEDVHIPPVYNVLYSFIKLPNNIKTRQSKLLFKTDYNLPLHPAVKILYNEYDSEENVDNTCKNRIGDIDCIIKNLK